MYAAFHGTLPAITDAAIDSAKEAVTLCIAMTGVMSFWVGLMKIAENSGMIAGLSRNEPLSSPSSFPPAQRAHRQQIYRNQHDRKYVWAWMGGDARGLKAMEASKEPNVEECAKRGRTKKRAPDIATDEMCTFLIVNISSLQLIPVNIIAYRGQYGSVNPAAIVGPALLATCCSTLAAIIFCKIKERFRRE